ncbi:DUF7260 family protein [Haloplanus halobius]|uniref:DUF7260 family protein n=1 Tax=Haloplanus halobius TaxID=2934938 RepID=UPI00200F3BFA|nr:hypothetical protein [Haloplanus sp. XH21]
MAVDGTIDAARAAVDEERACVRAERDAFAAFNRRVADLPTASVSASPPAVPGFDRPDRTTDAVRTAYVETVMDVAHYGAEYGDTVPESLAVEFGDTLAAAIVSDAVLTPEIRGAVRSAATAARDEREAFLDVLDHERSALARAADDIDDLCATLRSLDVDSHTRYGFDTLRDRWSTLDDLEARVADLGARRQETIRGYRGDLPGVPTDLTEYLYADLSVSYPVLDAVGALGTRIDTVRGRIERVLTATA